MLAQTSASRGLTAGEPLGEISSAQNGNGDDLDEDHLVNGSGIDLCGTRVVGKNTVLRTE